MDGFPGRIALVDDDEDFRRMMRVAFDEQQELVFMTCGSGEELILRIRELQPDLVLLDMRMPRIDGVETLRRLRDHEDATDVPVILLTGAHKLSMQGEYERLGVIGVVHKPVDPVSLYEKIGEIWAAA
ncbi:MAG: response regulator [Alphaproteobacteria bacterium]|nr:response regulator [Alphaproteobacteria bacterium]